MKNTKTCPKHGIYPKRFDSCPTCNSDAKSTPLVPLTTEQHIARLNDSEIQYIWNNAWWTGGTEKARQLCLAEYDKRIGLENWPAHISKEV